MDEAGCEVSPVLLIEEWQHKLEASFGDRKPLMGGKWWGYDLTIMVTHD